MCILSKMQTEQLKNPKLFPQSLVFIHKCHAIYEFTIAFDGKFSFFWRTNRCMWLLISIIVGILTAIFLSVWLWILIKLRPYSIVEIWVCDDFMNINCSHISSGNLFVTLWIQFYFRLSGSFKGTHPQTLSIFTQIEQLQLR